MADDQRSARLCGVLFILTFLTSIPAVLLFQPVLDDPAGYIAGGGSDSQIYLGALLEFFLILANIGTAVVLYPIARRQSETLAIGYVAARVVECVFLAAGIIFVLGVLSLRHDCSSTGGSKPAWRAFRGARVPGELSLGIYAAVWGFRKAAPILATRER